MNQLKIPEDRVGCLIGKAGATKKLIERKTKCKLKVSKEGDVLITGEALDAFVCDSVIRAIGRGFNPNVALKLIKEDHALVVVSIREVSGKSKKDIMRVRGRLIGKDGKAREMVERLAGVDVVVYGKTVSLIGEIERVSVAKQAVENLIKGSEHGNVYKFIQRRKDNDSK